MTANHTNELRIDLTAANGTTAYETYQNFSLSQGSNYSLRIGSEDGTAGWYLTTLFLLYGCNNSKETFYIRFLKDVM